MKPPALRNSPNKLMRGSRSAIACSPIRFEKNTRGDDRDTRFNMLCSGGLQDKLEVISASHVHDFSFERKRPCRRLRRCVNTAQFARDPKNYYPRKPGNDSLGSPTCFPL